MRDRTCGNVCACVLYLWRVREFTEQLRHALGQPLPGLEAQERMMGRVKRMPGEIPANARPSAVLCLIFPVEEVPHILFMKRKEDNTAHSGQVSFPGGRYEEQDANYRATALREANEEVGILSSDVDILGALTSLYIPVSNFNVYPFVGYTSERPVYNLSRDEVSYVFEVPVHTLFAPENKQQRTVTSPSVPDMAFKVKAYVPDGKTVIWGATAMILSELEVILTNAGLLVI